MFSAVEGGIVLCRVMNSALPMKGLISGLKKELESYALK
jgi:TetR/AcrR family transcriptional repressor of nem operon